MFALLVGAVGGGVDFSYANAVRVEMQAAADSAVLAASVPSLDDTKREAVAGTVFAAAMPPDHEFIEPPTVTVDLSEDGVVKIDASGRVATKFAKLIGFSSIDINASAVAAQSVRRPEIAFVLDVSGSMRAFMGVDRRINVLKQSTKTLIDTVNKNAVPSSPPAYAIVPFNMNVNVGAANTSFVTESTHALFAGTSWAGCVLERAGAGANSDAYNQFSSGADGKWHAYIWPPDPNSGGSCSNRSDGTNSGYLSVVTNPIGVYKAQTAGPNYNCVRHAITPLEEDPSAVKSAIDKLTAESNMGTIIAPGVAWGMRVLSESEPFTQGEPESKKVRKIIVVLTDGEQTTEAEYGTRPTCNAATNSVTPFEFDPQNFGLAGKKLTTYGARDEFSAYGFIRDSDPFGSNPASWSDVADDLYKVSMEACDNAKAYGTLGIEIFSIAVSADAGPGTKTYDLLKNCASDEAHFFYAADSKALETAFQKIADEIVSVHLTK